MTCSPGRWCCSPPRASPRPGGSGWWCWRRRCSSGRYTSRRPRRATCARWRGGHAPGRARRHGGARAPRAGGGVPPLLARRAAVGHPLGSVRDPRVFDWRDAARRLRGAEPQRTLDALLAPPRPAGSCWCAPLRRSGAAPNGSTSLRAGRPSGDALAAQDPRLRVVAVLPTGPPPAGSADVQAVVYELGHPNSMRILPRPMESTPAPWPSSAEAPPASPRVSCSPGAAMPVVVLEAEQQVGGLAKTVVRDGYRFDLGGHRFFTKSAEVERALARAAGRRAAAAPAPVAHPLARALPRLSAPGRGRGAQARAGGARRAVRAPTRGPRRAPRGAEETFEDWVVEPLRAPPVRALLPLLHREGVGRAHARSCAPSGRPSESATCRSRRPRARRSSATAAARRRA